MLLFAILFAALGGFGVYVGLDRIHYAFGQFGEFGVRHYGWGLALNGFALAAFFVFLWRQRAKGHGKSLTLAPECVGDNEGSQREAERPGGAPPPASMIIQARAK